MSYTVRSDRPRIWLTPQILSTLKSRTNPATARWNTLHQCAARVPDWDPGPLVFALTYVMTGDPAYADKAIGLMQLWVNNGLRAITGDSGYQTRVVLPDMAVCYDWCYDRLTPAQRTQFQSQMEQWVEWVWPDTNPARSTDWAVDDPGNNYYHGFMQTWTVGLSLSGDSPKAQGYIDLAREKWMNVVLPYLNSSAAGGYFLEGSSYGVSSLRSMLWYLLAHSTATDENLIGNPWLADANNALLQLTTPSMDRIYPGGDQALNSARPITDYDRTCGLIAAAQGSAPAKFWLDNVWPSVSQARTSTWEEFLWYPEGLAGVDYRKAWSPFAQLKGAGVVTSRSGWGNTDTQIVIQAGPLQESHQDRAAGDWMLFKTDWLAAQAKLLTKSGLCQDAIDHNVITVDGGTQSFGTSPSIAASEDTPSYTYVAANLAAAYGTALKSYSREWVFLKPGYVVIRDLPVPVSATSQVVWHLQTLQNPAVAGGTFVTSYPSAKLFGVAQSGVFTATPVTKSTDQTTPTYRLDLPPDANGGFLVAVEAASAGAQTTTLSLAAGGMVCGGAFVRWEAGSYASPVAGLHVIPGLKPNTPYTVSAITTGTGTASQSTVTSSAAGVLCWNSLSPVGTTITIVEGVVVVIPKITGYVDANGNPITSATPGTVITIQGSNLPPAPMVDFGGFVTVSVSANGVTSATVPTPPTFPFTGTVNLNANGNKISGPSFTITAPPPPTDPVVTGKKYKCTFTGTVTFDGEITLNEEV